MATIDSYHFGQLVINGQKYSSDVVISPNGVQDNWYRKKGHELSSEDITEILAETPEVLIVGTGASGLMRVLPEAKKELETRNIQLIVEPTNEACEIYNQLSRLQRVVAALHLTC